MSTKYNKINKAVDDIQTYINNQPKHIGKRLWKKIVTMYNSDNKYTKTEITARVKALKSRKKINGSKAIQVAVDEVMITLEYLRKLKSVNRNFPAYVSSSQSITERLKNFKINEITCNIDSYINYPSNGNVNISLTNNPIHLGYIDTYELDWNGYSKGCKYPMKIWNIRIMFPSNWRLKVLKNDLAVVDGMITLDANRLSSIYEGIEVYSATWLEKTRGYSQNKIHGYIARIDDVTYHGSTQKKAENGVINKLKRQSMPVEKKEAQSQKRRFSRAKNLAKKYPMYHIAYSDSEMVGNCESGTRSWCYNVGINPDLTYTTLSEFVEGYLKSPLPEAWSVFLYIEKLLKNTHKNMPNETIDRKCVA